MDGCCDGAALCRATAPLEKRPERAGGKGGAEQNVQGARRLRSRGATQRAGQGTSALRPAGAGQAEVRLVPPMLAHHDLMKFRGLVWR